MTLTAILIGNETLTAECGQQWLDRGHGIVAVITQSAALRDWARGAGLRVEVQDQGVAARLDLRADWLLSIANLVVIPAALLARAAGAVNFHDGPLPRHAGLNAPVWALLQGDTQHGITWHHMAGGVDEGAVLVQRMFDILPEDTALSLNTKCFAAGIDSFPDVMAALEAHAPGVPQDLSRRTLHLRADRPAAQGRIDFGGGVAAVLALVRALDHGRYLNPLTLPKVLAEERVIYVAGADIVPGHGAAGQGVAGQGVAGPGVAGQVLAAGMGWATVACADGAVRLTGLRDTAGAVDLTGVAHLPSPDAAEAARLTAALAPVAHMEPAMRRALVDMQPVLVGHDGAAPAWHSVPVDGPLPLLAAGVLRLLGLACGDVACGTPGDAYLSGWAPWRIDLSAKTTDLPAPRQFARDVVLRDPDLRGLALPQVGVTLADQPIPGTTITLAPSALHVDTARLPFADAQAMAARIAAFAKAAQASPGLPLSQVPILPEAEVQALLHDANRTAVPYDRAQTIVSAFAAQVARTPDATALVFEGQTLTYAELATNANRVAHALHGMGVGPGTLVGLHLPRSADLVVAALGILQAGGAYVPMDPAYPADRTALYMADSACAVIVTTLDLAAALPAHTAGVLTIAALPDAPAVAPTAMPGDLAYVIYTSGSTGWPKGVMVEHRNVINFFVGMDARIGTTPGTWMAVTSLSFDISVLELFWTLTRGFRVIITSDENRALVSGGAMPGGMDFSLYYWGNDDGAGPSKYDLLLEGARFADTHGFTAVWTPERHFHAFGGPYPNSAVTGAAVAAVTKNIGVRAGSCVAPLHHPARIAEEWAVIDNLTNGRAGIAFASGWQPDDFVLRPENTPPANKAALLESLDQVRRLWRGEAVEFPTQTGTFAVTTQPRPVSRALPVWLTTAGNPDTWREAGRLGANVLTHLLGQTVAEVGDKIAVYHAALRAAGHDPASHAVTLMLHSFIAPTRDEARAIARAPMKDYLRAAAGLIKQYAWAFPAFKKPQGVANPMDMDIGSLAPDELEAILDFAFLRYFDESGLFGTVEDAMARVAQVKMIGVTEIACLIDFGIAPATVMQGLRPLAQVVAAFAEPGAQDYSIAAQLARHAVTHLQCTPSMARMMAMNDDSRAAMAGLQTLMLGGEALPGTLVADLRKATPARILNMYGPTETTIWSSVEEVGAVEPTTNIGTPIANTQMYVLDPAGSPMPMGAIGELWIGGDGVARGYWRRDDLTEERFRADPFVAPDRACPWGARMYGTGDLVRRRADGKLDFMGRADHQVKLRGYRIELGEIEAVLEGVAGVSQAVVLAREDVPGDVRLVAYVTGNAVESAMMAGVQALPAHMHPAHYVMLTTFPLTPNRKVDRKALPAPKAVAVAAAASAAMAAPIRGAAGRIAAIWQRLLGVPSVGPQDNFFALGGHSLLAVQAHREIRAELGATRLSITDIFRFPTLEALARHLGDAPAPAAAPVNDRADTRLEAMARRRAMRAGRAGVDA